jgi:protein-L-isoaspartate(D-aspartate) O-methyltransferase
MDYSGLRKQMVSLQIEMRGIKNRAVLQAMRRVPRDLFVPSKFLNEAYSDYPLPIGYRQTISQPYIVALMTELLQLKYHHKVLEIGTGCGYQTAVLAEIAERIYSVEIVPELAELAKKNLQKLNYHNILCKQGDGLESWENEAPFDRIIVAAAPRYLPEALVKQLRVGGYMIIPIGSCPQILYCIFRKSENEIEQKPISHVAFVPMVGMVKKYPKEAH